MAEVDEPHAEIPSRLTLPGEPPELQHLFGLLVSTTSRLGDHLHRMDEGVFTAVDDVAAALRVLVYPGFRQSDGILRGGRGNFLIQRIADLFDERPAQIITSPMPVSSAISAVGSIPVTVDLPGLWDHGLCRVTVDDWLDMPVVVFGDDPDSPVPWARFIANYANKFGGAHADNEIPQYLRRVDLNGVGTLALSGYLLYQAGIAIWDTAQELLLKIHGRYFDNSTQPLFIRGAITEPPRSRDEHGHLHTFAEYEQGVLIKWCTPNSGYPYRLRLFIDGSPWEIELLDAGAFSTRVSASPLDDYVYQAPGSPYYPPESLNRTLPFPSLHPRSIFATYEELRDRPKLFPGGVDEESLKTLEKFGHRYRFDNHDGDSLWEWVRP